MSLFGLFHTAISLLPVGLGALAFWRDGKIDLRTHVGKWYLATMLAGSISAFGFILTKGFTPPQVLTLVTLAVLGAAVGAERWLGRIGRYVSTVSWSLSYLLLWVFTTTETLTRVPVGHPFAAGPDAPELIPVRMALLAAFLVGTGLQIAHLRSEGRQGEASVAA